jgi:hypothetical protein
MGKATPVTIPNDKASGVSETSMVVPVKEDK